MLQEVTFTTTFLRIIPALFLEAYWILNGK